jgi:Domain of unknown function (DUF4118)
MDRDDNLFYAAVGPFAAIILGAALTPLRGLTPASNLAFAFMALTIVVAELGGGGAALATAAVSALSLDFFLTQPYLRLSIEDKHDVIAFVGLSVCGLIAAAFGVRRERRVASGSASAHHNDLLRALLRDWDAAASVEPQLERILATMAKTHPIEATVVRDTGGQVVASSSPADALRPIPPGVLRPEAGHGVLPREGGRIALSAGTEPIGWLDVWGDGRPASAASRLALADLACLVGLRLAAAGGPRRNARP